MQWVKKNAPGMLLCLVIAITSWFKKNNVKKLINHLDSLFANGRGAQWIVSKALKKGIGIHHGSVPKYIQQEIISLFNQKI